MATYYDGKTGVETNTCESCGEIMTACDYNCSSECSECIINQTLSTKTDHNE